MAKNQNTIKWLIISVVSLLFLASFIGLVINGKNRNKPQTVDGKTQFTEKGMVRMSPLGNPGSGTTSAATNNPRVTLVEFADLQCPACRTYHPVVKELLDIYPGDVRLIFKHFPLIAIHPNAMAAAIAAEAAGQQGKFFEFVDLAYEKQGEWASLPNPEDKFAELAKALGLDVNKFKSALSDNALEDKVEEQRNEGIKNGVQGTPSFFINGVKIENPKDLEAFKQLVDKTLSEEKEVKAEIGEPAVSPTVGQESLPLQ